MGFGALLTLRWGPAAGVEGAFCCCFSCCAVAVAALASTLPGFFAHCSRSNDSFSFWLISNINNELERGQNSNRHGFRSSAIVQLQCRRIIKDEHEVIVERGNQAEAYIRKEREGNK